MRSIFGLLGVLHIPQLLLRVFRAPRILLYHGVTDRLTQEGIGNHRKKHIRADAFESHLKLLLQYYAVVPLSELVAKTKEGKANGLVALTFDDGYANFYQCAYPLFKKYNIPATFYISGNFVDRGEPLWVDRLEYALGHTKMPYVEVPLPQGLQRFMCSTQEERMRADDEIRSIAKRLPNDERIKLVTTVENLCGICLTTPVPQSSEYAPVTWDQCREMLESGLVTFGAHTLTHPILSSLTDTELESEVRGSIHLLETHLGIRPETFAYPNGGKEDFTPQTIELLQTENILYAPTTQEWVVSHRLDIYKLPRITMDNTNSSNHFLFRLSLLRALYMRSKLKST